MCVCACCVRRRGGFVACMRAWKHHSCCTRTNPPSPTQPPTKQKSKTPQASTLSFEERARVLDITAEEVKGKIPIVVGTGTIDPKTVVKLTKQAVDHGADAR